MPDDRVISLFQVRTWPLILPGSFLSVVRQICSKMPIDGVTDERQCDGPNEEKLQRTAKTTLYRAKQSFQGAIFAALTVGNVSHIDRR